MKRFVLFAIVVLISQTLSMPVDTATASIYQLFCTIKVKANSHSWTDVVRLESDGTVQVRDSGSLGTWFRTGNKLVLKPDKSAIETLLNSDGFSDWMKDMGHSSGSLTIKTVIATGAFLSNSIISGTVKATVTPTIDGQASVSPILVSIDCLGVLCKNGSISGTVNAPHCGCVEARNLATNESYELGCAFDGGGYGDMGEGESERCDNLLPPGNYEVCLRDFCGAGGICKSPITVGESESVTVNFP